MIQRIKKFGIALIFSTSFATALPPLAAGAPQTPPKAQRYQVRTAYSSSIDAGAARVDVTAETPTVIRAVRNFDDYPKRIKWFERVRVVGHHGDDVDVYMQVPILKGVAKIWAIVRFSPPKVSGNETIVEGHMTQGNVERLDAKWRIVSAEGNKTHLELEMLIVPKLPVPGSIITGEVAYAADQAVSGIRDAAEGR